MHHHHDVDVWVSRPDAIGAFIDGTADADVYICGPGPFMDLVEATLLEVGVDADRIFIERFVNAGQSDASGRGGSGRRRAGQH